jgi:hypothetical protein
VQSKNGDIAEAIRYAARHLGTSDAATPMGALECVYKAIVDGCERIAQDGLVEALERIADALSHLSGNFDPAPASPETLMRQAGHTAEEYMCRAVEEIDRLFGEGYAKANPGLVGAFMQTAALSAPRGTLSYP